jgi:transcriptional regulator with XRE-family HTH domain
VNIVKALRKKSGLQQQELAYMVDVSRPTVSEWENNKKDPSGERLKKLSQVFGVDELVILGVVPPDVGKQKDTPADRPPGLNDFLIELLVNSPDDRRKTILDFLQMPEDQAQRVIGYLEAVKENAKAAPSSHPSDRAEYQPPHSVS